MQCKPRLHSQLPNPIPNNFPSEPTLRASTPNKINSPGKDVIGQIVPMGNTFESCPTEAGFGLLTEPCPNSQQPNLRVPYPDHRSLFGQWRMTFFQFFER